MKILLLGCLALLLSMTYVSCGGDEPTPDDGTTDYTETELSLHGGNQRYWKLIADFYNGTDLMQSYQECEKDDVHVFDIHGNYNIDAGATKCTSNPEPDLIRGYYELDEQEKSIFLSYGDTSFTADIVELTPELLRWQVTVDGDALVEKSYKLQ